MAVCPEMPTRQSRRFSMAAWYMTRMSYATTMAMESAATTMAESAATTTVESTATTMVEAAATMTAEAAGRAADMKKSKSYEGSNR